MWSLRAIRQDVPRTQVVSSRHWTVFAGITLPLLAVLWFLLHTWATPVIAAMRNDVHQGSVSALRSVAVARQSGTAVISSVSFTVHYPPGDQAQATIVLRALDHFYPQVRADFGLAPAGPWPVEVETAANMARIFGPNPPIGAYWQGVIWLLLPSAWLPPKDVNVAVYEKYGPVAHEITHLADDLRGGGRLPRWLDEGLAQYEDWRLTGYVWWVPDNSFADGSLYTYAQLDQDFDALPNQAMAYRQALAATAALCRAGPGDCLRVITDIARGQSALQAIASVLGPARYASWLQAGYWVPGQGPLPWTPAGPAP